VLGVARAVALRGAGGQAPIFKVIWGMLPVEVKEFLDKRGSRLHKKPKQIDEKQEKTGKNP
jgi:hypothetical protein